MTNGRTDRSWSLLVVPWKFGRAEQTALLEGIFRKRPWSCSELRVMRIFFGKTGKALKRLKGSCFPLFSLRRNKVKQFGGFE
jgi:hypothetical protein